MANDFTAEEKKVFGDFQVADNDVGLKNLISAQRKLNGALCKALWATLDALENKDTITRARLLTQEVAKVPPGCDPADASL